MKYWIENVWKKQEHVLVRTALKQQKERQQRTMPANVSSTFLIEIGKLIQVTNITHSNRDKLPYNVHIKDKRGVVTCRQFKSVNNHSECKAKAEAVISHKSIALLSRYKILRGLDSFSLLLCVTSHLYQGSFFN